MGKTVEAVKVVVLVVKVSKEEVVQTMKGIKSSKVFVSF